MQKEICDFLLESEFFTSYNLLYLINFIILL